MKTVLLFIGLLLLAGCTAAHPPLSDRQGEECVQPDPQDPIDGGMGGTGVSPENKCPPGDEN